MNKTFLSIILMSTLIQACSHTSKSGDQGLSQIEFDSNLILPWSKASKNLDTAKSPSLYEFKSSGKTLFYLASQHSNKITDPAFKLIKTASDKRPDILILEGFSKDLGVSPKSISTAVLEGVKDGFYPSGEVAYAVQLANEAKIPFVGGEPSDTYLLEKVTAKGYSANDLLNFDFVRRMPQMNRSGELNSKKVELLYADYVKAKAKSYGYKGSTLTFDEFKKWYQDKQGKAFSNSSGEKGETAPIDDGPFFTQKISLEVTRARDEHILQTIAEMMSKYDKVLIIYGSSHYRIQHEALKKALGQPQTQLAE